MPRTLSWSAVAPTCHRHPIASANVCTTPRENVCGIQSLWSIVFCLAWAVLCVLLLQIESKLSTQIMMVVVSLSDVCVNPGCYGLPILAAVIRVDHSTAVLPAAYVAKEIPVLCLKIYAQHT